MSNRIRRISDKTARRYVRYLQVRVHLWRLWSLLLALTRAHPYSLARGPCPIPWYSSRRCSSSRSPC